MQASVIKKGEGEVDKLCRLMEMRDDGTISDEIYDAVLQKYHKTGIFLWKIILIHFIELPFSYRYQELLS